MYKTLIILFLTTTLAQSQSTLLCEDDFTSSTIVGCNISTNNPQILQRTNGVLQYNFFNSSNSTPQSVSVLLPSNLSDFDTLKLEMDLNTYQYNSFNGNQILFENPGPLPIQFNYTDSTNKKSYTGSMIESIQPIFYINFINSITTYAANKLVLKIVKPTSTQNDFMFLQPNVMLHIYTSSSWGELTPPIISDYRDIIYEDPTFINKIKQSFCTTTGNLTDCLAKVSVNAPPVMPFQFSIDNFKAYGIKNIITGLEEETRAKIRNNRTLVGIYNSLGQKLDLDQPQEGLVIKIYSDGTKEKVFVGYK